MSMSAACRSVDEVRAAARATVATLPPLTQQAADLIAAILASRQPSTAARAA